MDKVTNERQAKSKTLIKKRIIGVILLLVCAALVVTLIPTIRIVGEWHYKTGSLSNQTVIVYKFNSDKTGQTYVQQADGSVPADAKNLTYELDGENLTVNIDGVAALADATAPADTTTASDDSTIYNVISTGTYQASFLFNRLGINDTNYLDYAGVFTPMHKTIILVVLAFVILWLFEDDINYLIHLKNARSKRKAEEKKAKKQAKKAA